MAESSPRELFPKKDVEITSKNKRRVLTDRQWLAINREKVIQYFCQQWQAKYGIAYILPAQSFMSVQKPIADALAQNYTIEQLKKGIDAYLTDEWKGFAENTHPIKFFTNNLTKWVLKGEKFAPQEKTVASEQNEIRELNQRYGIVRKGDCWCDEDGGVFLKKEDAIASSKKKHKPAGEI